MKRAITLVVWVAALTLAVPSAAREGAKIKVLHTFGSAKDGTFPSGPLLENHGSLYGTTNGGGGFGCEGYGCGTVFRLAQKADGRWSKKDLHDFSDNGDGARPVGNLVLDAAGNIYGTLAGLQPVQTALFQLTPGPKGWSSALIYTDATGPGLLIDKVGNLYGGMGRGQYKYGAIAELSPGSGGWNYAELYSFCSPHGQCPDGYDLAGPLVRDEKGNMFGAAVYGGVQVGCWISFGCGLVFEMTPNGDGTWTYDVLYRFLQPSTKDGQTPSGGLVMDASGNLYGTTGAGGVHNNGTVFELAFTGGHWRKTVLYDFPQYCDNGCGPGGNLALDKAGNLYGANGGGNGSCSGGTYFCGMIYKLAPQKNGSWKYSSVYKFNGTDGFGPNGVTLDSKGNIYGTTVWGGAYNFGVAFEITVH